MSGDGSRVSIPAGVRPTIQNIKEIAGNHSDEEIYAMLKECGMDPNETAQKLLLQDPFHEVKRKRDRRKENVREPADPRWRAGLQGRGGRGGRGNYSSRPVLSDAAAGRNLTSGKVNGVNQGSDKGIPSSSSNTPDTEVKSANSILSSISGPTDGPSNIDHPISSQRSYVSGVSGIAPQEESFGVVTTKTGTSRLSPTDAKSTPTGGHSIPDSDKISSNKAAAPVSEVYVPTSDPLLAPSLDAHNPAELENIKRITGIQHSVVETATSHAGSQHISGSNLSYMSGKCSSMSSPYMHGKVPMKPHESGSNELSEKSQVAPSSFSTATGSRPSSTYSNRSQQLSGLQKAPVPNKEWKPKSTPVIASQASEMTETPDVPLAAEAVAASLPAPCSVASEVTTLMLEKKLEELKLSDRKHVIIPNHLQVSESERHGLSFGSFDPNFELNMGFANGPAKDRIDTPVSDSSQETEETTEQPSLSTHTTSSAAQDDFINHPQSPEQVSDNYSSNEAGIPSSISAAAEYDQSQKEAALVPEGLQNSVVQSAPSYPSLGLVPQVLGNQLGQFESSEHQAQDTSRFPSFLVQQTYDPSTSYYTPFYRPTADSDGRISPFLAPGASMYNRNIAVLPSQTGQASNESTNAAMLSTAGSTPLATQAAGTMQGSVAIPQQPVPVFRQPAGLHISHYPPNYIPYNQYFSPFYVPPPTLHHFLSSPAFPQQPPTGSMFPTPGSANPATPVKYSLPQYKPGANIGNSTIVGMPAGYGMYNSTPAGYTPDAATSGNSTANDDLGSSQFKENNLCIPGQQSESLSVWIPAPGRDISTLQASSYYSIPQGQHMTYAPTQAGHGAFSGVYHPPPTVPASSVHPLLQQSQTVAGAVEMVGPPAGVYQQPQHAQINWTNNY
ncbi:GBF-interacting protein 1-like [Musa acuminata AAA Group]|uniref:GBF-interacting protein 1-like n=1 Tax=Musa acuminata AAA Group TaxID=214697 RepID=UPI0031E1EA33